MLRPDPYWLLIPLLALGLWFLHSYDKKQAVHDMRTQTEVRLNKEYDLKLKTEAARTAATEKQLRDALDVQKKTKDAQIQTINTKLVAAIGELRNRPTRPASTPNSATAAVTGQACTARELYREDAEFLTREAARAESVLVERDYYYNSYQDAAKKLEEHSRGGSGVSNGVQKLSGKGKSVSEGGG